MMQVYVDLTRCTVVYDGTAPAAYERELGPGRPKWSHAYPDGSDVALCGATGHHRPSSGDRKRCPACLDAARPSFIAR